MTRLKKIDVGALPGQQEAQWAGCILYVVEEAGTGHFKIGIAGHPRRRLSGLQCGNFRKLNIVAAYQGARSCCREVELIALRFFRAAPGSEWVWVDSLAEITEFLDAFEVAQ
jgi:hypothetical protein